MNTVEFLESIYRKYTAYVHAYHPAAHPDPEDSCTFEGGTAHEQQSENED